MFANVFDEGVMILSDRNKQTIRFQNQRMRETFTDAKQNDKTNLNQHSDRYKTQQDEEQKRVDKDNLENGDPENKKIIVEDQRQVVMSSTEEAMEDNEL